MANRNIHRGAVNPANVKGSRDAAPIYVDSDDNILKIIPGGTGSTTEIEVIDESSVQTLTNKTIVNPSLEGVFLNVVTYGATGNGSTDDTAAFTAALAALSGNVGGVVWVPEGLYKITSTLTIPSGVSLVGASAHSAVLVFVPTGADTLLEVSNSASINYSASIKDLRLYAQETTFTKIAIDLVDADNCLVDRVIVTGNTSSGGSVFWGGNSSIGIRTRGRNNCTIRSCSLNADKPLVIAQNPNNDIDIDHFHFQDLILVGNGNPIVTIDSGVALTHVTFDGYQAWVKGTAGLLWTDTTSVSTGIQLKLSNVRYEQAESATGYLVNIAHNVNLHGLVIDGLYGGLDCRGIKLRNVKWATISNFEFIDDANEALNLDASADPVVLTNCWTQTGATATLSGVVKQFEVASTAATSALPLIAVYGASTGPRNVGVIPAHADNAAALAAGLVIGDLYRTSDALKVVHA